MKPMAKAKSGCKLKLILRRWVAKIWYSLSR
jgi:hypothetical protein